MSRIIICWILTATALFQSSPATIINIPGDYPSIQDGINAASDNDTVLVWDGIYFENINFYGKSILVRSANGPEATIIQTATTNNPIVIFEGGEDRNSVIEGFAVIGDLSYWGIYCFNSSPTIYNNVIESHEAGIRVRFGGPLIRRNTIKNCEHLDISPEIGAGIYIDSSSNACIDSNVFHDNIANLDPALAISFCDSIVLNHNIAHSNISYDYLSCVGISNSSNIEFYNNTLVDNSSVGINYGSFFLSSNSNVSVINNICAFNDDFGFYDYGGNSNVILRYNDCYGNTQGDYYGFSPGTGSISQDPLFVDFAGNDYRLLLGSPCIDSGDPDFPLDPDGTVADMGAIFGGNPGLPGEIIHVPGDYPTIQEAVNVAVDGDTVLVQPGTYMENVNFIEQNIVLGSMFIMTGDISYISSTIIDGDANGSVITLDTDIDNTSTIEGFTITNGNSQFGGGIDAWYTSPIILNNIIINNTSTHQGGGISLEYSAAVVRSNIIADNTVYGYGAGIRASHGNPVIEYNLITGNHSTIWGGGFYVNNNTPLLKNNTVSGNEADECGGGLTTGNAAPVVVNCIFWGNSALSGPEIYNWLSAAVVTYSDVLGGYAGQGNIDEDPLFVGGDPFDYHLQEDSPCIDAGDPNSPLDPDGTIADMGAFYYEEITTDYGFKIADTFGENGQPVTVPVSAFGLAGQDIAGVEFHINFGNLCLQYDTVTSAFFTDMLINVVNDEIHILWDDYANPVFLPDSSEAFELQFTILGQLGDTCGIDWLSGNEIVDSLGNVITDVEYTGGSVRVIEFHSISGRVIYYDMLTPLEDIDIQLSGDWTATEVTDQNGLYQFANLFPGDFMICPERDDDDPGVTVSDVVKIRRHLVLLEPFDTPFKYVASDVNESEYVSVADIVKIRRYLAGLEPLPSGNWAFIDSSYAITNENWMDAPECIDFSIWNADLTDSSFVGVRMGDVDVTLGINGSIPVITDNVLLDLIDVQGSPGDTVVMPLLVQGFVDVAGIELHLEFPEADIEFVGVSSGVISDYTLNQFGGEIHLIWDDIENPLTLPSNAELLTVSFEILPGATENIPVSFMSAYVANVFGIDFNVYSSDGIVILIPVSIDEDPLLPRNYRVHQNYPNPFNAATTIKFELPASSQVKIEVFDLLGRKIETLVNSRFYAGYHVITWNANDYASGMYFYMVQAGGQNFVRKMSLIK
ncbi:MAG: right-handed parallel beta-helix repeat-containing protein [Candidatus Zixiibacteriota bacterium]|nr:MAG: right-handed parallel beta-helix repeat-containing protein [candidate division Zixibacteria bacterium]